MYFRFPKEEEAQERFNSEIYPMKSVFIKSSAVERFSDLINFGNSFILHNEEHGANYLNLAPFMLGMGEKAKLAAETIIVSEQSDTVEKAVKRAVFFELLDKVLDREEMKDITSKAKSNFFSEEDAPDFLKKKHANIETIRVNLKSFDITSDLKGIAINKIKEVDIQQKYVDAKAAYDDHCDSRDSRVSQRTRNEKTHLFTDALEEIKCEILEKLTFPSKDFSLDEITVLFYEVMNTVIGEPEFSDIDQACKEILAGSKNQYQPMR